MQSAVRLATGAGSTVARIGKRIAVPQTVRASFPSLGCSTGHWRGLCGQSALASSARPSSSTRCTLPRARRGGHSAVCCAPRGWLPRTAAMYAPTLRHTRQFRSDHTTLAHNSSRTFVPYTERRLRCAHNERKRRSVHSPHHHSHINTSQLRCVHPQSTSFPTCSGSCLLTTFDPSQSAIPLCCHHDTFDLPYHRSYGSSFTAAADVAHCRPPFCLLTPAPRICAPVRRSDLDP